MEEKVEEEVKKEGESVEDVKLLNKYWITIVLVLLLVVLVLILLPCIRPNVIENIGKQQSYWDNLLGTLRFLFTDEHNRFQWIGISAIGVLISYVISSKFNKNKLKADIVSKARIEWIQETRKTAVEFLSACYNSILLMNQIKIGESIPLKPEELSSKSLAGARITMEEIQSEIKAIYGVVEGEKLHIKVKENVRKNGDLLILYFGPDKGKENEFIVFLIEMAMCQSLGNKYFESIKDNKDNLLEELRNVLRVYFKVEWERARGVNKEEDANNNLRKNEIYKNVRDKYRVVYENKNDKEQIYILQNGVYEKYNIV